MKTLGLILIAAVMLLSGLYLFRANKSQTSETITVSPTQTVQTNSVEEQIIVSLSQKNNWGASQVELNVTSTEGDFAKGGVKLKDEMSGGLWFAARVNGKWQIVYDGNGIIPCSDLEPYPNFPSSLIPQCFDVDKDMLIDRMKT